MSRIFRALSDDTACWPSLKLPCGYAQICELTHLEQTRAIRDDDELLLTLSARSPGKLRVLRILGHCEVRQRYLSGKHARSPSRCLFPWWPMLCLPVVAARRQPRP